MTYLHIFDGEQPVVLAVDRVNVRWIVFVPKENLNDNSIEPCNFATCKKAANPMQWVRRFCAVR